MEANENPELAASADAISDERGASLVEYALLVALIAVVSIAAVAFFGGETSETFSRVGQSINGL